MVMTNPDYDEPLPRPWNHTPGEDPVLGSPFRELARLIVVNAPSTPARDAALRKLHEALVWATRAVRDHL